MNIMENEVLKNGITQAQSDKAREIIKKAGFRNVAKIIRISDMKIHNLLRGESPDIEILQQAIIAANEIIARKEQILKNLPV